MLIEFRVKNFLSFENEEIFDMVAGKGRNFNERIYKDKYTKILKFASLFGGNGSGKSNFVKAISFSRNYIVRGNDRTIIQKYFKLNPESKETPSKFEYKIKTHGKIYTYGFEVLLSRNDIISEWLICSNSRNDEYIYKHNREENEFVLGKYFKNNNLRNKLQLYAEGLDSSNHTLFLNTINQYKNLFVEYEEANVLKHIFKWFLYKLKVKHPDSVITDYAYFMSKENMDKIRGFFKDFDLSISDYDFIPCSQEQIALKLPKEIFNDLITDIEKSLFKGNDDEDNCVMFGLEDDFYIAKIVDGQIGFETLQFYHENTRTPFYMYEESDGTRKILKLLEILFQEDSDVVYIVDEIDRCLHPLLTYNFLHAFLEKAVSDDCQLIVTTHESILLDFKLLRKDEVRLVTKVNGSSVIESLGDSQIRADKTLNKAYLLGQIGVPNIKNDYYKQ